VVVVVVVVTDSPWPARWEQQVDLTAAQAGIVVCDLSILLCGFSIFCGLSLLLRIGEGVVEVWVRT